MGKISIFLINFYQKVLSGDTGMIGRYFFRGKTCGFYPTCSEYMKIAIQKHGFFKGFKFGIVRISKCTPLHTGEVDLVP